jgi:hypothetical protein
MAVPKYITLVSIYLLLLSCRSLGPLNYLRVWHDNTGRGSSASWFLKYIIVRDLQTMERFHFICQRWLAVEKDDGTVSFISFFPLSKIFFYCCNRSNVFYQSQANFRSKNLPMFYPKKRIIAYPKVICGSQSLLDLHRISLLVFNDVHVVLCCSSSPCFLIFCTTINRKNQRRLRLVVVYH